VIAVVEFCTDGHPRASNDEAVAHRQAVWNDVPVSNLYSEYTNVEYRFSP
jgi:hypothetical protein